jgi:hypothetical protein
MPMVVWGLDEIAESIVLVYAMIIGLLITLVILEQRLDRPNRISPRPPLRRYLKNQTKEPADRRD